MALRDRTVSPRAERANDRMDDTAALPASVSLRASAAVPTLPTVPTIRVTNTHRTTDPTTSTPGIRVTNTHRDLE